MVQEFGTLVKEIVLQRFSPLAEDQLCLTKKWTKKIPIGFHLRDTLDAGDGALIEIVWSPDGALLAACSDDKTIHLWNVVEGKLWHLLKGHKQRVNTVAWSPDAKFLASGSNDNSIHIWDAALGETISILEGHTDWVDCVAWSPDGASLASGSGDQTCVCGTPSKAWCAGF